MAPSGGGQPAEIKNETNPAEFLGLDGVKRIVGRWGFQGKSLLTDVRIGASVPRKGLVGWLDQPAFEMDRLPPIPQATRSFVVDSYDRGIRFISREAFPLARMGHGTYVKSSLEWSVSKGLKSDPNLGLKWPSGH